MKKTAILAMLCTALVSCIHNPESLSVIPIPQQTEISPYGSFFFTEESQLYLDVPEPDRQVLLDYISTSPISSIIYAEPHPAEDLIHLQLVNELPEVNSPEGYCLNVDFSGITIQSTTGAGLFYGLQTLLQLHAQSDEIPMCTIIDEPRFAYRGMMLDVSRHFFDVDFVKKQIDAMAHFKLNHLHLHLTDAAGWRIEIKQYPLLTRRAAWRPQATWKEWWNSDRLYVEEGSAQAYGGYYTQDQIRDIVSYAQKRYITVIPEIEMPSHSEEVLAVYPELSCSHVPYKESDFCIGNEQTFEFLENVLTEVIDLFPSEYIHIGGDEASKQSWKSCALCQSRMQREGLSDVDELQSYLIHRIDSFLTAHGRKLLGWDEILDGGLSPNATVMSWRGTEGGLRAIATGHRAIMTPGEYCYLDAYQDAPHTQPEAFGGYLPLQKVYSYDPMPDTLTASQASLLYGVQGNLFAEYIPTEEHMEYMMYPRLFAIAEVGWSSPSVKDYAHFHRRSLNAIKHMKREGYNTFDLSHEVGNRPGADKPIHHLAVGKRVSYNNGSAYYPSYTAGGDSALVDGWHGGWTYGDKRWQGFLGRNGVDITIDLDTVIKVRSISADFMQICGPGVFMPSQVTISASVDGQNYTQLQCIDTDVVRDDAVTFKTFGWKGKTTARYIRYQAQRSHHGGFLFLDEVVVK
ncbi:MAG: family 20 glycosylhydrolase [Bacteroidaceae bacterium]|nr:family 20 glycosylhydrolase [Bacteroidaceae bacterium]